MPTRNEAHARQDEALRMREAGAAWSVITETLGFAEGGGGAAAAVRSAERRRAATQTNGFIYTRDGRNTEFALRQQAERAARVAAEREATRSRYTRPTPRTTAPTTPRGGRTFGIEAEFVGNAAAAIRALAAVGIDCVDQTNAYNHITSSQWKIVGDGSVHATGSRGRGGQGIELVSPILHGATGLAEVKKALDAVRQSGGIVNVTCGLHVHVGMAGLNGSHIAKIIDLYRTNESNINQLVAPTRRNGNTYCRLLSSMDNMARRAGTGMNYDYDALRRMTGTNDIANFARNFNSRYYTVNVCAYVRHGTLEFRQHQGTLVGNKAVTWVQFVLAMVEKAIALDNAAVATASVSEFADFLSVNAVTKRRLIARADRLAGVRASRDANE